MKEDGEYDGL